MVDKSQIVDAARGWLGTPFHHQGRVRGVGCDCIGLLVGVVDELGLMYNGRKLSSYDRIDYAKVPDGNRLLGAFREYLNEIDADDAEPGDVLMFRFDKNPQHVGIVSDFAGGLGLIHCYMQARGVVEHRLDEGWREKVVAAFSVVSG